MVKQNRILTIDIMRGLTLFLMLFVNDLAVDKVPAWLTHRPAGYDGMGLADWVFPGFLFMVGMAIPYAIQSRRKRGDSDLQLLMHIIVRTFSLLAIGVLMLNVERVNPDMTGMPKYLWAILVYLCIFLIWNVYDKLNPLLVLILKGTGIIGIGVLLYVFKAGTPEDISWIKTGWWGILGLIGWGYLVASVCYLLLKEKIGGTALVCLFFVALNILDQIKVLGFLDPVKPVLGVILGGNVPSMVLAGLFFSLLLRKLKGNYSRFVLIASLLGIVTLSTGFVLRHWFILSKIMGTPSWAMVCNGISMLLFVFLFVVLDVMGIKRWSNIFKPAGQNSLTTYLAPNVLYYCIWLSGLPVLYYKQLDNAAIVVMGSLLWSVLMIGFAALLDRKGIRLKL